MKKTLLAVLTLLTFTVARSQTTDEAQIRITLTNYIMGSSYNRIDQLKSAFATNATLYLNNKEGDFNVYTPEQYADFFKNREAGEFNGRVGTILDVHMVSDIATAKVAIVISKTKARYVDLFLLKKIDGKAWKIISKTAASADISVNLVPDKN